MRLFPLAFPLCLGVGGVGGRSEQDAHHISEQAGRAEEVRKESAATELRGYLECCCREEDTENENKIWYYSTKVQLAELIDCLEKDYWEVELCKILEEMREEIHRHMDITEDLTDKVWGSNKSFLAAANEEILESIRAKKADTDNVKSPEEIEKDKNETEDDSKDAQKSREFEDQSLEKDSEYKTPDNDPEQGKSEEPNKTCESSNTSATTTSMRPDLENSNSNELNSSQSESAKAADDPENEERESHTPVSIQEEIALFTKDPPTWAAFAPKP
uniref:nucleosome-remodeling factor subunit BPTF-like isoform X2 n=1 Tax=Macaca mulatta TaxID=9544 RepID=UPI0010A22E3F|nr:nucleosome-remodeling factor subunit BPTF-like isoform X2 [Macaca mulatta]